MGINDSDNFSSFSPGINNDYIVPPPVMYMQPQSNTKISIPYLIHTIILLVITAIPVLFFGFLFLGVLISLFSWFDITLLIWCIPFPVYLMKYICIIGNMISVQKKSLAVLLTSNTIFTILSILDILGFIVYTILFCYVASSVYNLVVYLSITIIIDIIWFIEIIISITFFCHSYFKAYKIGKENYNNSSDNSLDNSSFIPVQLETI